MGSETKSEAKIIVWSDLHAHNWQEGERPDRWKDFIRAIDEVHDYARSVSARMVIFNGDLFESKQGHASHVWSRVVDSLIRGRNKIPNAMHILNTGNHDIYRGESVLEAFNATHAVAAHNYVGFGTTIGARDVRMCVLPWGCMTGPQHEKTEYVFTHAEINGLAHGHGMSSTSTNINPEWLGRARYIINGHIHVQQKMKILGTQIITVGPTIPISWTEIDDKTKHTRGLLEITLRERPALDTIKRVVFDWAPKFLREGEQARVYDFVREDLIEEDQEEESASEEVAQRRKFIAVRGAEMCDEYVSRTYNGADSGALLDYGKALLRGAE